MVFVKTFKVMNLFQRKRSFALIDQISFDGIDLDIFCHCGEVTRITVFQELPTKCKSCGKNFESDMNLLLSNYPTYILPEEDFKEI